MIRSAIFAGIILVATVSCERDGQDVMNYSWDFEESAEGWIGDFADYPVGEADDYELTFAYDQLPQPLDTSMGALKLAGTNMSDDLFMFTMKKAEGLEPNTRYDVSFTVQFASDIPDGLFGVGGSPGESVWIKAGAVNREPVPEEDNMGYYRMNIDKGGQSLGGDDMLVLGDFSNDTEQEVWTLKTVSSDERFRVTTDMNGEVWIIVGTDSGFEATTTIYYNRIEVDFE